MFLTHKIIDAGNPLVDHTEQLIGDGAQLFSQLLGGEVFPKKLHLIIERNALKAVISTIHWSIQIFPTTGARWPLISTSAPFPESIRL